jgi:hypothetical protein
MRRFLAESVAIRVWFVGPLTFLVCLLGASTLSAQGFEITPLYGYRFGGDFFELLTRRPLDIDGAPAVGIAVDVPTSDGFQIEALFTHQHANALVPVLPPGPPLNWAFDVDHWQGGGLQEYDIGRPKVRPFLTGTLGLTRYATEGQNEIRFTLGAGGGVKLFPSRHVGVRLDGRAFMTFADADVAFFACSTIGPNAGTCAVGFNANLVWQAEFTAGLVVKFN